MTNAQYEEAFVQARRDVASLSLKAQVKVKLAYHRATVNVSKALIDATSRGLSIITVASNAQALAELQSSYTTLTSDVSSIIDDSVVKAAQITSRADKDYLIALVSRVEAPQLNEAAVRAVYERVNVNAVRNVASRVYSDGYQLSARVWKLGRGYEDVIKEIITAGVAQGRDPVKITRDIEAYVRGGKKALAERWGGLERGSKEWMQRIRGDVDYRAQRLVRSEIQATVQSTALQSGLANPGATGEFAWILGPGLAHCLECQGNAAGGFYTAETIPSYPHPNCGCQVRPVLRDRDQLVADLQRWSDGIVDDENRYIDEWAQVYLNAA